MGEDRDKKTLGTDPKTKESALECDQIQIHLDQHPFGIHWALLIICLLSRIDEFLPLHEGKPGRPNVLLKRVQ